MIKTPTVLVLGAGASQPYGFPLGRELLFQVIQRLRPNSDLFNNLPKLGFEKEHLAAFSDQLKRSMQPSVDAFLEHRPEFVDVGKAAIARTLMPCEYEGAVLPNPNKLRWYEYLFTRMGTDVGEFEQNQLSIITFNYDRSLEYFLYLALKNSYGLEDEEAETLVASVPIVHVHGQLGPLPFEQNGRPFAGSASDDEVQLAAAGIRIVHETAAEDEQFQRAHKLIGKARVLAFLGFGYHAANVDRLKLDTFGAGLEIYPCTFGLIGYERQRAFDLVPMRAPDPETGEFMETEPDEDVLFFLRRFPVLQ